ncbi:hypothetical protein F4805DRAFT_471727 [Annulohypoxylon moriforme]|nr:hypothetical protein F4805DRAFT_471727 [Annulohypoxylon moriforme]
MALQEELAPFTWMSCDGLDDQQRIQIKEKALRLGIRQCGKLISEFESCPFRDKEPSHELHSNALGSGTINRWIEKYRDLIRRHQTLQIPIGVAGPTGSGKTSVLNALLNFRELLPTDNAAAATAVPCKVAYNDDDKPGHRFRASVSFRPLAQLTGQLDQFFKDLASKNHADTDYDYLEDDDYDAIRRLDSAMKPTLELIRTVFGIEEHDIKSMDTDKILALNTGVQEVLGTTKSIHSDKLDSFSDMIRPYINSSSAKHSGDGPEFPAWPLIDEVEIYVKSDILLNGVVLVDLPGLADSVESRAAVAEQYFPKLAATLIVSPASRAADNSTSKKLISSHQELRMKLDGKFHKRAYCVVLTQIDQIDRESDFKKKWAKSNKELQSLLMQEKELKDQKKAKSTEKSDTAKKLLKLYAEAKGSRKRLKKSQKSDNMCAEAKAQRKTIARLGRELHRLEEQIRKARGNVTFLCIKERNRFLAERIQQDFRKCQAKISSKGHADLEETYDGKITVCPTSSKAYWSCSEPEGAKEGFPTSSYSGIPKLREWIKSSTIQEREAHADRLLHELHSLYNVIQTWSKEEWSQNSLNIDRARVEKEVLPSIYEQVKKRLNNYWADLGKSVHEKNPLRDNRQSLENCAKRCKDIVRDWSYKNPSSKENQHWLTYQANIQRNGGKFVSKSGEEFIEYYWMEQLSDIIMETIVKDWNQALNHDIPKLKEPAAEEVDVIWGDFDQKLRIEVEQALPDHMQSLDDTIPKIDIIKQQIKDKVEDALISVSKDASHTHPNMVMKIQERWKPTFENALEDKGRGSYNRRKKKIWDFASKSSEDICSMTFTSLRGQLNENFSQFSNKLYKISDWAIQEVEDQINPLMDSIAWPEVEVEDTLEEKLELQERVRGVLTEWDHKWKAPILAHGLDIRNEGVDIPNEYDETSVNAGNIDLEPEDMEESLDDSAEEDI